MATLRDILGRTGFRMVSFLLVYQGDARDGARASRTLNCTTACRLPLPPVVRNAKHLRVRKKGKDVYFMGLFSRKNKENNQEDNSIGDTNIGGGIHVAMDADSLFDVIGRSTDRCPKCGLSISFHDGAQCAQAHGIDAHVIQCPNCSSLYTVDIGTRGMTILEDVTEKYRS